MYNMCICIHTSSIYTCTSVILIHIVDFFYSFHVFFWVFILKFCCLMVSVFVDCVDACVVLLLNRYQSMDAETW